MSLRILLGRTCLEVPFNTLLVKQSQKIMGSAAAKRFGSFFPIRVHYDDSIDGGNMAIQVHPPVSYVKNHFNERVGQDESYYIARVGPGSKVFLGVKNNVEREEFFRAVRKSEIEGTPMDYQRYVNSFSSRVGDLFSIPAGTVHASGRNEIVLEIGNSYGYTFHIYDYVRPDLNGNLRPIHADHAFRVLRFHRNASWAQKHLKQKPKLIRSGQDWAEYSLGEIREIFYKVHRLEFSKRIDDTADGKFHILTLIGGQRIAVQSKEDPSRKYALNFSETVIVPACLGEYSVTNLGPDPCKVIKVFLK
jgi:mannose-6-phosphate isomerase class I